MRQPAEAFELYRRGGVPSQHPQRAKKMTDIAWLPREKVLYLDEPISKAGKKAMWRSEQKNTFCMKDHVRKVGRAGDLVMDTCADKSFTAKGFRLFEPHRQFVRCDVDPDVLSTAEPELMLTFAFRVLIPKSDTSECGEIEAAAKVLTDDMAALLAWKRAPVCRAPPAIDATQVNSGHILHFLSTLYYTYL